MKGKESNKAIKGLLGNVGSLGIYTYHFSLLEYFAFPALFIAGQPYQVSLLIDHRLSSP